MRIRRIQEEDIEAVLRIYEPYILETVVTFEYTVPTLKEFRKRVEKVTEKYPWYVCEQDGEIVGYAYASDFRTRTAFAWDCELSIYLKQGTEGQGFGTALYQTLLQRLTELGYVSVYGVICTPNESSEFLHKKFGFEEEGKLRRIGYKMGKWLDLSYQVKHLRNPEGNPGAFPKKDTEL